MRIPIADNSLVNVFAVEQKVIPVDVPALENGRAIFSFWLASCGLCCRGSFFVLLRAFSLCVPLGTPKTSPRTLESKNASEGTKQNTTCRSRTVTDPSSWALPDLA